MWTICTGLSLWLRGRDCARDVNRQRMSTRYGSLCDEQCRSNSREEAVCRPDHHQLALAGRWLCDSRAMRSDAGSGPSGLDDPAVFELQRTGNRVGFAHHRMLLRAHGDATHWNRTHIDIMVLYLPVALTWLVLLPLALILVPSNAFSQLGSGFLALGFLQSTWKSDVGPVVVEEEPRMCQVIELRGRSSSGSASREVPVAPVSRMAVVHAFRPAHPRSVTRFSSSREPHSSMYDREAKLTQDLALRRSSLNRLRDEYLALDKAGKPCNLDAAKDARSKVKQQTKLLDRDEGKGRVAAPNRQIVILRKPSPDNRVASSPRTPGNKTPGNKMRRLALVTTGNSAASPETVRLCGRFSASPSNGGGQRC